VKSAESSVVSAVRLAVASLACLHFFVGCGYHFAVQGTLPSKLSCLTVGEVSNNTREPGRENAFRNELRVALARRGLVCGLESSGKTAVLSADIWSFRLESLVLAPVSTSELAVAEYQVIVHLDAGIDSYGEHVWDVRVLIVRGEFPAEGTDVSRVGVERTRTIVRLWQHLAVDAADRLVLLVMSGL